jgi:hypothetical protein
MEEEKASNAAPRAPKREDLMIATGRKTFDVLDNDEIREERIE